MTRMWGRLQDFARDLLIQRNGPLTRELLLKPGKFGLGLLPESLASDQTTRMICGFCSTGCSLDVHMKEGRAVGLTPSRQYPVNLGMACPKGWEALAPLDAATRATTPMLRIDGSLTAVSWQDAIGHMVEQFRTIGEKYGPAAVAWLGTGQMPTEELAFLGALGKFGMGMLHGDGNTRQCMATSAVAYKQAFGFDAPPFSYQDFEQSDTIILIGSNLCIAHPIMWERICRNPHRPTIIVIDPRKTETAVAATHHFALRPKADLILLYAVARELIARGHVAKDYIRDHTEGFDAFREHVQRFDLAHAAQETGLSIQEIERLVQCIQDGKRVSFWWTMGVNQSHQGTRTAQAIIALALMTGNMGRPGTGANSVTGQCNAMGSRLFSNTTGLFGGRSFEDPSDRREVAQLLHIDESVVPRSSSLAYDQIIEGILAGKIKALWVIATNPAHSWINQSHLKESLSRLECLVVQDMYADTETAQLADILLPAAAWGEKEGTFINSERRIGVIKRVARAPGEALADFSIFQLVAHAWGCADMFREWSSPEQVFQILKRLSRGRPCDITGISDYPMIDRMNGIQWPFAEDNPSAEPERRLFEDGRYYTPNGKARFLFEDPRPVPEESNERYPLQLLTGRGSSSQWHTQTRTRHSSVLRRLAPSEPYVEISPVDARALGISPEQKVLLTSQRGSVQVRAFVTNSVAPGQVFVPMHFETMNQLTFGAFDPYSRQPAYKGCAVRVSQLDDTLSG